MIYAASVNRTIGMVIAITILVVAALFVLYRVYVILSKKDDEVGSEIELAANRKPYLEDEELDNAAGHLEGDLGILKRANGSRIFAQRRTIERAHRLKLDRPDDLLDLRRRFLACNQ